MDSKLAAGTIAFLLSFGVVSAATPEGCSSDTFQVDGAPLTVGICPGPALSATPGAKPDSGKAPAAGKTSAASLVETFSTKSASFTVSSPVDFLAGAETSRTIDDVSLARLGIAKTIHMTIAFKPGSARLERALLIPGAVVLK